MKVKTVIAKLQKLDPEMIVSLDIGDRLYRDGVDLDIQDCILNVGSRDDHNAAQKKGIHGDPEYFRELDYPERYSRKKIEKRLVIS